MKLNYNVKLNKNAAEKLSVFLTQNKIKFRTSDVNNLIKFEILVNTQQKIKINEFLDTLD